MTASGRRDIEYDARELVQVDTVVRQTRGHGVLEEAAGGGRDASPRPAPALEGARRAGRRAVADPRHRRLRRGGDPRWRPAGTRSPRRPRRRADRHRAVVAATVPALDHDAL